VADDSEPGAVGVRTATADDELPVRRVLDGAMLEVPDDLTRLIERGQVLVAVDERVVGALVLVRQERGGEESTSAGDGDEPNHVEAVAVRRRRRGNGIGTALVRAAVERCRERGDALTAEFRPAVCPFYESLGFEVREITTPDDETRLLARLS
jgi:GNAT superfamily N-acetyltransferase